jgi:hypothetical protein
MLLDGCNAHMRLVVGQIEIFDRNETLFTEEYEQLNRSKGHE